jgi:hypothetical protein
MTKKTKSMLIILLTVVGVTCSAQPYNIDIDWPTSSTKESILAITVNQCETRFSIKNGDLIRFEESTKDLDEALKVAIKRYEDGCKK